MTTFQPSAPLQPFVQAYMVFSADRDLTDEVFYPSCYIDVAVNISPGAAVTVIGNRAIVMPKVELLGQLTVPTRLSVKAGTVVLIARLYPFAATLFFRNSLLDFTNQSLDIDDILGNESQLLFEEMMTAGPLEQQLAVFDAFLMRRMLASKVRPEKVNLLRHLCNQLSLNEDQLSIRVLAAQTGLSERYLQKLFNDSIGLPPKTYFQIQRFNQSLSLVRQKEVSLTSIAHHCGYFDQAHFIKEFRRFTGITPFEARHLQLSL